MLTYFFDEKFFIHHPWCRKSNMVHTVHLDLAMLCPPSLIGFSSFKHQIGYTKQKKIEVHVPGRNCLKNLKIA